MWTVVIITAVYIVDPCLSTACPFGQHCVALDEFNTRCESYSTQANYTTNNDVCNNVSNPCQNAGRCYRDASGDAACRCPFDFRGRFCDSPVDMCVQFRCGMRAEYFSTEWPISLNP